MADQIMLRHDLRISKKPCPSCKAMGLLVNKAGGILCQICHLLIPVNDGKSVTILDRKTWKRVNF